MMSGDWTFIAGAIFIGLVVALAIFFAYSQRTPQDGDPTEATHHFDGFTMDDDAHSAVHASDVGFERD